MVPDGAFGAGFGTTKSMETWPWIVRILVEYPLSHCLVAIVYCPCGRPIQVRMRWLTQLVTT